jgi:transcriptional regulator with XRE-family HTH domain
LNTIGERLREEREKSGKNQTEFGALGGVLKGAQINYEQDKRQPDAAYLSSIAADGVDVLYILTGMRSAAVPPISPRQRALLDNYEHSDESGKSIIEGTANLAAQSAKVKRA